MLWKYRASLYLASRMLKEIAGIKERLKIKGGNMICVKESVKFSVSMEKILL